MSTKFTKPIVINAPDKDIVFDGIDFTAEATIEITAAASVTFKNCRFYNVLLDNEKEIPLLGNAVQNKKGAGYKLVIENCYFGKTGVYNMISVGQIMYTGSCVNKNYFTRDCSKDDKFACYFGQADAEYNFCNNEFEEYSHNGFQCSFVDSPALTINIEDNHIGPHAKDIELDVHGLVRFRPFPKATKSFANVVVNANRNVFKESPARVMFCQRKSERDIVLDNTNVPKYCLDGRITTPDIVDSVVPAVEAE